MAVQEGQPPVSTNFIYELSNGTQISDSVEIDDNNINDSYQNEERGKIIQPILFDTINSNAEKTFNNTDSIINDNGISDEDGEPIENANPIVLENSFNNNNEEEKTTVLNGEESNNNNEEENTTVLNEEESTIEQEETNVINNNNNKEEV